ncbi:DUF732 domain-containing protein [Pseudonocardia xishanensis]|uniref:DUF732 domain-containing protein n=1 Tax=Pseudonocardia xishanensis TaxID=630995 RepID=A0ABP8S5R4_9PSEU
MAEHGGTDAVPAPREAEGPRVPGPRHAARDRPAPAPGAGEPAQRARRATVPHPRPPHPRPPDPRPPTELRSARPPLPFAQVGPPGGYVPRHAAPPYVPPLPRGPRQAPGWVLPSVLSAVIVLAGAALLGIASVAWDASRGTPSPLAAGTGDRAFLGSLAAQPSFARIPDDTLIDLGHSVCAALEDGSSRGELVSDAVSAGFGTRDALLLVDAANAAYCPAE